MEIHLINLYPSKIIILCAKVLKKKKKDFHRVWLSEAKMLKNWAQLPKFSYQLKVRIDICTL